MLMQTLAVFDDKNYDPGWSRFSRSAVRAVIRQGGRLALVKCAKEGYYKFPGGGIEPGETQLDALVRETREETGLHIIPESVRPLGMVHEVRRGLYDDEIFDQRSYYYLADVRDERSALELDGYEAELGYALTFENPQAAWEANLRLAAQQEGTFLRREAHILSLVCERMRADEAAQNQGLTALYQMAKGAARRFPRGNEPFQMATRLLEECGEVAKEINHWEDSGIKRQKYGEPNKADLANEIRQSLVALMQIAVYYHVEDELRAQIEQSLSRLRQEGLLDETQA